MSHINVDNWNNRHEDGHEVLSFRLKAYAEDFEVRELPLSGPECYFDDPEDFIDTTEIEGIVSKAVCATEAKSIPQNAASSEEAVNDIDLSRILTTKFVEELEGLNKSFVNFSSQRIPESNFTPLTFALPLTLDKAKRQQVHQAIHDRFPCICTSKMNKRGNEKENENVLRYEVVIDSNLHALLAAHCPLSDVIEVSKFLQRHQRQQAFSGSLVIGKGLDKAQRTCVHRALASHFPRLQARTVSVDDEQGQHQAVDIRVKPNNKRKISGSGGGCTGKIDMYLHFTLVKQNTEHFRAVCRVATAINVSSSCPAYAGMKDKQAVTCQRFSVPLPSIPFYTPVAEGQERNLVRTSVEAASRAAEGLRAHFNADRTLMTKDPAALCRARAGNEDSKEQLPAAMSIGKFEVRSRALQLGQLAGNRFRLFLRETNIHTVTTLSRLLDKACEDGFPNYYGSQRFTTFHSDNGERVKEPVAAVLGRHLLRGELRDVVITLFREAAAKKPTLRPVLISLLNGDSYAKVVETVPAAASGSMLEVAVLRNLVRYGALNSPPSAGQDRAGAERDQYLRAYALALRHIPHSQRKLWTSAHQAWLWNAAVSERLQKLGSLPAVGDLILAQSPGANGPQDSGEQDVEVVTATMLASCTPTQRLALSLRVVYPLYGSRVIMPEHECGRSYAKEVATLTSIEAANNSLVKVPPGAYRTVLAEVQRPASCEPVGTNCCEMTFGLSPGAYATTLVATLSANEIYL